MSRLLHSNGTTCAPRTLQQRLPKRPTTPVPASAASPSGKFAATPPKYSTYVVIASCIRCGCHKWPPRSLAAATSVLPQVRDVHLSSG
jgi:hypothetical protein